MATRNLPPTDLGSGRTRMVLEGVLAALVLAALLAAVVGALAWALVQAALLLVD
jgi:hypothetical protein